MLSSGREASRVVELGPRNCAAQSGFDGRAGGAVTREWIKNRRCGAIHSRAGIETSTQMGSDQTAAEALQEAETEVGVAGNVDQGSGVAASPSIDRHGGRCRPYGLKVSRFVPAHMQENRCSWWKDGDRGNCVGGNDNASDLAACWRAY